MNSQEIDMIKSPLEDDQKCGDSIAELSLGASA
jgi:hypothetical protein